MQAEGRGVKFVTTLARRSNNNNGNRREGVGFVLSKYVKRKYEIRMEVCYPWNKHDPV